MSLVLFAVAAFLGVIALGFLGRLVVGLISLRNFQTGALYIIALVGGGALVLGAWVLSLAVAA
jgi:hypothetical protein